MRQEFTPFMGVGKRVVFLDNSLIYGSEEYPYSELSKINVITHPSPITNGVAQTNVNGKTLTLSYTNSDKGRFSSALNYANEQIDSAHGITKNYKYLFQAHTGTSMEVYDDHLILHCVSGGITKVFGSLASGGGSATTDNIIMFEDIGDFQLTAAALIINGTSIPLNPQNAGQAKEIFDFIETARNTEVQSEPEVHEVWEPITGVAKAFPISGGVFNVPADLAAFNAYRVRFRAMAVKYSDRFEAEYKAKVRDFITFIEFFPRIYITNLEPLIQKAVDVLVSEEIWSVTFDSLMEEHREEFCNAFDSYDTICESAALTSGANQEKAAGAMSLVPNLVGGGFGLKGAAKGILAAGAFNAVRDGIENSAVSSAANVNPAQQQELYGRIDRDVLFEEVFADYWNVFMTLAWTLRENGKEMWWQSEETVEQADNIFQNLSNPNFPQDRILGATIGLLEKNPYDEEYYEFIESRFGATAEVAAIKEYFGI
jgi:hypothetical protein